VGIRQVFYKMENPSAVIEKYLARFDAVAQSLGLD
jgi:hypothetical protein